MAHRNGAGSNFEGHTEAVRDLAELEEGSDLNPEGVDRGQIRWMLSLSPTERLAVLQNFVDTFAPQRHGSTG